MEDRKTRIFLEDNKIIAKNQNIELLRFTTAGSVDDGKSTLIGRLLFDTKSILQDQLKAIESTSKNKGFDYIDLSLLTDGLNQNANKVLPLTLLTDILQHKSKVYCGRYPWTYPIHP